jgi:hypothetical protein
MEVIDVYTSFRKAQSNHFSRPYRLPKDFEYYCQTKMSPSNRDSLEKVAKNFSTRWQNIDLDKYMQYGFELFGKGFTYSKFTDRKLLNFYIEKDKNEKREVKIEKRTIITSAKFVKKFIKSIQMEQSDVPLLTQYGRLQIGRQSAAVSHYLTSKIDKYFLVWLSDQGVVRLTDQDRAMIPLIVGNYREYLDRVKRIETFFVRVKESINE